MSQERGLAVRPGEQVMEGMGSTTRGPWRRGAWNSRRPVIWDGRFALGIGNEHDKPNLIRAILKPWSGMVPSRPVSGYSPFSISRTTADSDAFRP